MNEENGRITGRREHDPVIQEQSYENATDIGVLMERVSNIGERVSRLDAFVRQHMETEEQKFTSIKRGLWVLAAMFGFQLLGFEAKEIVQVFLRFIF